MLTCHSLETETSELPYECWRQVIDFILAPEYIFLGTAFNHVNNKTGQTKPDCVLGSQSLKQNKIWVSFQSHQASDKNLWLNTKLGVSSIYNSNSDRWGSLALSNSPHSCTVITNSLAWLLRLGKRARGNMISFHLVLGTYLPFALSCSVNLLMSWCSLQLFFLAMLLMFLKCKGFAQHVMVGTSHWWTLKKGILNLQLFSMTSID